MPNVCQVSRIFACSFGKNTANGMGRPVSRIDLRPTALAFDRRHRQPAGIVAAAAERDLAGDTPPALDPGGGAGRIEGAGSGRRAVAKQLPRPSGDIQAA